MINIRNAREDEAALLADIGLRAWEQAMTSVGETDSMIESARAAFVNFTRSGWLTITVIERNGVPLGWAAREALDENISDFWIDPAHQHQGLGAMLLARMENEIVEQGFEKASLQTHAGNAAAIGFFQAHGYAIHWLSLATSPKLDRDVQSVGLSRQLIADAAEAYGPKPSLL